MDDMNYVRRIDHVGRILIPKEIRRQIDLKTSQDAVEFYIDGDRVVLKKYNPVIPQSTKTE